MLVDLHLRFYPAEELAARNHLENKNGNIIKQLHSCPDQLNLSRDWASVLSVQVKLGMVFLEKCPNLTFNVYHGFEEFTRLRLVTVITCIKYPNQKITG